MARRVSCGAALVVSGRVVNVVINQRTVVSVLQKAEMFVRIEKFLLETFSEFCSVSVDGMEINQSHLAAAWLCCGVTRGWFGPCTCLCWQLWRSPPEIVLLLSYVFQCNLVNLKMLKLPGRQLALPFPVLRATSGSKGTGFLVRCG